MPLRVDALPEKSGTAAGRRACGTETTRGIGPIARSTILAKVTKSWFQELCDGYKHSQDKSLLFFRGGEKRN
jgi:hypothetical protein